jgi:DNA-binding transcriptional LysR family regulator
MQAMKQRHRAQRNNKAPFATEFRHLRAFVALVDQGSITGAAQALGLAQSTVSESLTALERGLGAPITLRRRGARDVLLTAAGHTLLPHARGLLASLDAAHVAVASVTNNAHASVEIVTNESVSTYVLPKALANLRVRWPNTSFAVTVATCPGVRAGVRAGEFDIGLLLEVDDPEHQTDRSAIGATILPALSAERVIVADNVRLVVFASPFHPLILSTAVTPVPVTELAEYPLFMSDAAGDFHTLVSRFFESDGIPGPHLEASGSVEAVKRAVANNTRALGILPTYAISEELQTGHFVVLSLRPAPPRMRLEALLSDNRARHPAVTELIDSMRDGAHK